MQRGFFSHLFVILFKKLAKILNLSGNHVFEHAFDLVRSIWKVVFPYDIISPLLIFRVLILLFGHDSRLLLSVDGSVSLQDTEFRLFF